jgi:hypothetical protein
MKSGSIILGLLLSAAPIAVLSAPVPAGDNSNSDNGLLTQVLKEVEQLIQMVGAGKPLCYRKCPKQTAITNTTSTAHSGSSGKARQRWVDSAPRRWCRPTGTCPSGGAGPESESEPEPKPRSGSGSGSGSGPRSATSMISLSRMTPTKIPVQRTLLRRRSAHRPLKLLRPQLRSPLRMGTKSSRLSHTVPSRTTTNAVMKIRRIRIPRITQLTSANS